MGANSLNSDIDIDRAMYERRNRMQPPEYAPGQEPKKEGSSNLQELFTMTDLFNKGDGKVFDNSPQEVDTEGMNDDFSNPFAQKPTYDQLFGVPNANNTANWQNWGTWQGFNTGNQWGPSWNGMSSPYPYQNRQSQGLTYEKAEEIAVSMGKGLKSIITSFSKTTPLFWLNYCKSVRTLGLVFLVVAALLAMFGVGNAFATAVSGLIMVFGGLGVGMILSDKASEYLDEYKEDATQMFSAESKGAVFTDEDFAPQGMGMSVGSLDVYSDDEDEEDTEIEDDFDLDDLVEKAPVKAVNPEEVLNNLQEIPKGMYSRKYLYDMFVQLLPSMCPEFSTLKEITAKERAFYVIEEAIKEAVEVTGCKEEIEVLKLYENYATIIVTTTRPTGLKLDAVSVELAQIYSHRSSDIASDEARSRVYAKAEAVGKTCIFTIFTGKTEMISLKDMYKQVEDYVLDSKNYLPVVFGIDPMAKVIAYDLKNLESIIIAGMPRSGKSWFAQNMITQMAAFTSPKDLQFYVCDPKGDISDFKPFCLPHVKRFVTSDADIMQTLRWLVKKEAPRRKKIIGAGNNLTSSQNIWDYKARYPDVEGLPIIYVVIDEVVTLASRMDKDTFGEFRAMLRELISQLPALGIRAILIPHVLKNDIIEKKTSDLVLCRVSVCGNAEHIESVTGAKPKDFPFQLTMPGDMSVCMPPVSQKVMYLRAPVLNKTNEENRVLFDVMRRMWSKLEPETVEGSVAENIMADSIVGDSDLDGLDLFEPEDEAAREFKYAMNN